MVVAQTNLQLYNQLIEAGFCERSLSMLREAYDLSRMLFPDAYRPNHKPFVCHLVGVASVLAHWGERPSMVAAGMLHSAYLYGNFGDRQTSITEGRRQYVRQKVGEDVEALVYTYSTGKGADPLRSDNRDLVVLYLADLFDELSDHGAAYSNKKELAELSSCGEDRRAFVTDLANRLIHEEAAKNFGQIMDAHEKSCVPDCLKTDDTSWKRVRSGIPELKPTKSLLTRLFK